MFLTLNCAVPLVEGILITISNYKYFKPEPYKKTFAASIIVKVSVGALQFASGVFLGYAVVTIRSFLSKGISSKQINLRILVLHSLTFSLYMMSVVVFYVYFSLYYIHLNGGKN